MSRAVMQQALDALLGYKPQSLTHAKEQGMAIIALREALTQPAAPVAQAEPLSAIPDDQWQEAVLNELIVCHIYTTAHDTNPRKAVQDAIAWHCKVALDPLVSSDAQALILAERERCAVICDELGEHYSDYKDTALLNGDIDLSNAASGEPRAAAAIADAIRNGLYRDTSKPPIGAQE